MPKSLIKSLRESPVITQEHRDHFSRIACVLPKPKTSGVHPNDRIPLIRCEKCPFDPYCDDLLFGSTEGEEELEGPELEEALDDKSNN